MVNYLMLGTGILQLRELFERIVMEPSGIQDGCSQCHRSTVRWEERIEGRRILVGGTTGSWLLSGVRHTRT